LYSSVPVLGNTNVDCCADVIIFPPTFRAGTKPCFPERKALLVTAVAGALGIPETDIITQLYDANLVDTWKNYEETEPNLDTANGKAFLTYNPDIFQDGKMVAYQVWAGAQVNKVDGVMQKQPNNAINTPMMSVSNTSKPLCQTS
jgi:hypothetical protein